MTRPFRGGPALCVGLGLFFAACGASTKLVPVGPHPPHLQEFVTVTYPPPPAEVEDLPPALADPSCAWMDGHYNWDGRRWAWETGRWVVPPAGCYYAPPVVAWSKAGEERLYFTPPRWYRDEAANLTERTAQCPAPRPCSK
jgi:hypothetical protein